MCCDLSFERGFGAYHAPEPTPWSDPVPDDRRGGPAPDDDVTLPTERGQSIEENDRQAAHAMRGENLTEEEFAERAAHIKTLRRAIEGWRATHVPEGTTFDSRPLKALVDFLSKEHADTINAITKNFLDRRMYPKRPVVKLRLREIGEMPDVLIFGWRGGDPGSGETKIHDHAGSTVAITVHQGEIEETVYRFDRDEWAGRRAGQSMKYLGSKSRRYPEGLSKTYKDPYLHTVGGTPENDLSVTVHAYWRPSTQVAYDFMIDGDQFVEIGIS